MGVLGRFLSLLALAVLPGAALAQVYPAKPIKLMVPYAAGGVSDILGCAPAQNLTEILGQNMVVDNRAAPRARSGPASSRRTRRTATEWCFPSSLPKRSRRR